MNNWKRTFIIIWTGQTFSTLSSYVVGYAVMFWLSITTQSAEILAFAIIASLLPQLVVGLFAGVLIDRWKRKQIMIIADIFTALCTLIIALLLYLGEEKVSYFFILLGLRSIGTAFHVPAMQASVPLLAPEDKLMRIAGVNNIIQSLSSIAGPAIAALLITVLNMTFVLSIDVIGAMIAVISLLFVRIPDPEKKAIKSNVIKDLFEGFNEIYKNNALWWMFIIAIAATFFIMPVAALFPLMTIKHFSGNTYQMSIVEIAWGLGMLAGGALMGIQKLKYYKVILINLMYLLLGLSFVFSGILPSTGFILFVTITVLGGISMSIYSGAFTVVMQTMVNASALGRVFSLYGSITLLPSMIGLLATGFIADHIGIGNSFIISGLVISFLGIMAFIVPSINKIVKKELSKR